MSDLVNLVQTQSALAASLPPDQSWLPAVISAASNGVQLYTRRDWIQQNYVELRHGKGFSAITTRQYPVNKVTRLATTPQPVLTVQNVSPSAVRATAGLAATGDPDTGYTVQGIDLNLWSGGSLSSTTVEITAGQTLAQLAQAIRAIGNGWQATVAGGDASVAYGQWLATDFLPVVGDQACLFSNGGSAEFQLHVLDTMGWDVNQLTGEIRYRNQTFDPIFALMNLNSSPALSVFPPGWLNIRIEYNAGYATVPADIQEAVFVTIKSYLYELQTVTKFEMEQQDKFHYTLSQISERGIPDTVKQMLRMRRSYRTF